MKTTAIFSMVLMCAFVMLLACGGGDTATFADSDRRASSDSDDVRQDDAVTFVYTLPPGAPEPIEMTVMGWTGDGKVDGDLCSSIGAGGAERLTRSGDTYRCTIVPMSDAWADGQYNVQARFANASRVPSGSPEQYYCYERLGGDVPEGCSGGACAYRLWGQLVIENVDLHDCRVSNGLDTGCNVSLRECI